MNQVEKKVVTEQELYKHQTDAARGERARCAMDNFIDEFIEQRTNELYIAFISSASSDKDRLMNLKLQANETLALRDHMKTIIDTGKMASMALAELETKKEEE